MRLLSANITYDDCVKFMQEHPNFTRTELKQHYSGYFNAMKRLNLLDDLCPTPEQKRDALTIEECIKIAQQYKTIKEIANHAPYIFRRIKEAGVEAEAFKDYNKHNMFERMIYAYEFPDNHAYIGLTHNYKERGKGHLRDAESQVYKHIKETGLQPVRKELTDYMSYNKAQKAEGEWVEKYKQGGWIILNVANTGGLGSSHINANHSKMIELSKQGLTVIEIARELGCSTSTVRHLAKINPEFVVNNKVKRKVGQYDLEGNLIRVWNSAMDAAIELGMKTSSNIGQCCRNAYGRNTVCGYKWKFVN